MSELIVSVADVEPVNSPLQALSKMVPVPESLMSPDYRPATILGKTNIPTAAQVNNKKVLQSVRSPKMNNKHKSHLNSDVKKTRSPILQRKQTQSPSNKQECNKKASILRKSQSSEEESEMCDSKLQTIQQRAEEKRLQKDAEMTSESSTDDKVEQAAVFIQKMWRGYLTRNKNKEVQEMFKALQSQRANQYIQ